MKKIIALAVASAFVAPAVMAEAVIYGSLRSHVEYAKFTDNGASNFNKTQLVDDLSRIGFKGSDKLDAGVNLFWQVENRVRIGVRDNAQLSSPNSQLGFGARDTFVGVSGKFGEVSVGRISDLTDSFVGDVATGLDYWNGANASTYIFATQNDTSRLPNAALYVSPTFSGIQAKALYDFGKKTASTNYYGYQGQLAYTSNLFKVGGVYKHNTDTNASGDNGGVTPVNNAFYKSLILAGTVSPVKGMDVTLMWNRLKKDNGSGTESKQDVWALGATYALGKHAVSASFGKLQDRHDNGAQQASTGARAFAAQYKYSLSKQTSLMAAAATTRNDSNANQNMQFDSVANGARVTTVSVGVRTDF